MAKLKTPVSADDHAQGNEHASITLIEYGDYQCPACGTAYPIIKRIQKHFGKKLRFVFRHFPLSEVHPLAEMAAEIAEFAASHKRFWEMHDLLFANQDHFSISLFVELTEALELSVDELKFAIENKTFVEKIKNDITNGIKSEVNYTPTFFINGLRYDGSFDYETLVRAIELYSK